MVDIIFEFWFGGWIIVTEIILVLRLSSKSDVKYNITRRRKRDTLVLQLMKYEIYQRKYSQKQHRTFPVVKIIAKGGLRLKRLIPKLHFIRFVVVVHMDDGLV